VHLTEIATAIKVVIKESLGNDNSLRFFVTSNEVQTKKGLFLNAWLRSLVRFLSRTPVRTFLLYPVFILGWEAFLRRGWVELKAGYILLMVIGYGLYKFSTNYRVKHGGGGHGEKWEKEPERLITTGPYAFTRNPVYLGHLIFLLGLALTLQSLFAVIIAVVNAIVFHRILNDEKRLASIFGQQYVEYKFHVSRWIPGVL
jgi:protein-S-isoprenylcysteine O-methyltransferase Ste14